MSHTHKAEPLTVPANERTTATTPGTTAATTTTASPINNNITNTNINSIQQQQQPPTNTTITTTQPALPNKITITDEEENINPSKLSNDDSLVTIRQSLLDALVGYQARRISELERLVDIKRAKVERLSAVTNITANPSSTIASPFLHHPTAPTNFPLIPSPSPTNPQHRLSTNIHNNNNNTNNKNNNDNNDDNHNNNNDDDFKNTNNFSVNIITPNRPLSLQAFASPQLSQDIHTHLNNPLPSTTGINLTPTIQHEHIPSSSPSPSPSPPPPQPLVSKSPVPHMTKPISTTATVKTTDKINTLKVASNSKKSSVHMNNTSLHQKNIIAKPVTSSASPVISKVPIVNKTSAVNPNNPNTPIATQRYARPSSSPPSAHLQPKQSISTSITKKISIKPPSTTNTPVLNAKKNNVTPSISITIAKQSNNNNIKSTITSSPKVTSKTTTAQPKQSSIPPVSSPSTTNPTITPVAHASTGLTMPFVNPTHQDAAHHFPLTHLPLGPLPPQFHTNPAFAAMMASAAAQQQPHHPQAHQPNNPTSNPGVVPANAGMLPMHVHPQFPFVFAPPDGGLGMLPVFPHLHHPHTLPQPSLPRQHSQPPATTTATEPNQSSTPGSTSVIQKEQSRQQVIKSESQPINQSQPQAKTVQLKQQNNQPTSSQNINFQQQQIQKIRKANTPENSITPIHTNSLSNGQNIEKQQQQQQQNDNRKQSRYWTQDEHDRFLAGVVACGPKNYGQISEIVRTRSAKQVRTHAQKFQKKIEREQAKKRGVAVTLDPSNSMSQAAVAAVAAVMSGAIPPSSPSSHLHPLPLHPHALQLHHPLVHPHAQHSLTTTPTLLVPPGQASHQIQPTRSQSLPTGSIGTPSGTLLASNGNTYNNGTIPGANVASLSDSGSIVVGDTNSALHSIGAGDGASSTTNSGATMDGRQTQSSQQIKNQNQQSFAEIVTDEASASAAAAAVAAEAVALGRGMLHAEFLQGMVNPHFLNPAAAISNTVATSAVANVKSTTLPMKRPVGVQPSTANVIPKPISTTNTKTTILAPHVTKLKPKAKLLKPQPKVQSLACASTTSTPNIIVKPEAITRKGSTTSSKVNKTNVRANGLNSSNKHSSINNKYVVVKREKTIASATGSSTTTTPTTVAMKRNHPVTHKIISTKPNNSNKDNNNDNTSNGGGVNKINNTNGSTGNKVGVNTVTVKRMVSSSTLSKSNGGAGMVRKSSANNTMGNNSSVKLSSVGGVKNGSNIVRKIIVTGSGNNNVASNRGSSTTRNVGGKVTRIIKTGSGSVIKNGTVVKTASGNVTLKKRNVVTVVKSTGAGGTNNASSSDIVKQSNGSITTTTATCSSVSSKAVKTSIPGSTTTTINSNNNKNGVVSGRSSSCNKGNGQAERKKCVKVIKVVSKNVSNKIGVPLTTRSVTKPKTNCAISSSSSSPNCNVKLNNNIPKNKTSGSLVACQKKQTKRNVDGNNDEDMKEMVNAEDIVNEILSGDLTNNNHVDDQSGTKSNMVRKRIVPTTSLPSSSAKRRKKDNGKDDVEAD